ncbi:MAG: hypothetical protein EXS37_15465 [Opitutus sp.]|nr:hypothetical protein [Opitutus sp.]
MLPRLLRRALMLLVASAHPAFAQTTASVSSLPAIRLEEFTVSGKALESYQADRVQVGVFRDVDPVDVPLTVNVLTREALDAQSARTLFDALKNTAGATRSQLSGSVYDNIAVRGILVENRGNYRLNGSLPIINLIDLSLENKERVEVLLSPHWTVFAEAGRAKTYRHRLFSQVQNYNLTTGAATLNIGFTPSQAYRNTNGRAELFGRFLTAQIQHNLSFGFTTNTREQDIYNLGTVNFATNLYNPLPVPQLAAPTATTVRTPNKIVDTGVYLYDRVTALDDHVQVIAGVRTTDYSSDTTVFTTNNTTRVTTAPRTLYEVSNKLSPMITAAYKPTKKSSIYVSYLKALEAGATAGTAQANAGFVLPPLESRQYEVGVKVELVGGVLVQLGYFDIERPSTFINAANVFTVNGKSTYKGTELFASGEIMPALSLIASGTVLDSEQTNAANATTFGRIPQGTAKYTGSLFLEWRVPGMKGLAVSGGSFYVGRRPMNDANQAFIGGYTTFTGGASYRFTAGGRAMVARVNGENLFNRSAWSASNGFLATNFPRLVKFSLTTNF